MDTGIGIPKENQDKLFKLFGFLKDHKQMNVNGVGLGLMISKLIVEKFDGNISFVSEEDQGSTFTFTFKLPSNKLSDYESNTENQLINQCELVYHWNPKVNSNLVSEIKTST